MLVEAAPSLAGQVALELMRSADESARPVIDAALDAIGMLGGQAGDADRGDPAARRLPVRPCRLAAQRRVDRATSR